MKKEKPPTKRLSIDIPEDVHFELRLLALRYRTTIKKCIMAVLLQLLSQEKDFQ